MCSLYTLHMWEKQHFGTLVITLSVENTASSCGTKTRYLNVTEPYKHCRVMPEFFRFPMIMSSWSELASVLRSVRRTMLRRSIFFPL